MRRAALALALLAALSAVASALDCAALGFSGFALCSSCDALENAVHDAGAPHVLHLLRVPCCRRH